MAKELAELGRELAASVHIEVSDGDLDSVDESFPNQGHGKRVLGAPAYAALGIGAGSWEASSGKIAISRSMPGTAIARRGNRNTISRR